MHPSMGSHESEVQLFISSQGSVRLSEIQPMVGEQVSVVQAFPSSQTNSASPVQAPSKQESSRVQRLSSSQEVPSMANSVVHSPVSGSHPVDVVHIFASHSFKVPEQTPSVQVSSVVHRLPSSHGTASVSSRVHPKTGSQTAASQGPPSGQARGTPAQIPSSLQASSSVHSSPSSQLSPVRETKKHSPSEHPSMVQFSSSLQSSVTPSQTPFSSQASSRVQASSSSQTAPAV